MREQTESDLADFSRVLSGKGEWKNITVPYYFGPTGNTVSYYRTVFALKKPSPDQSAFIHFDGVDYIAEVFYRKALFFYQQTLINETGRIESIEVVNNFGPDTDKNYGYDGVIYLSGLLEYKYGQRENQGLRLKKLEESKKAIARIFGLGKSSKSKPGPLLETARDLYDKLAAELSDNNVFSDDDE